MSEIHVLDFNNPRLPGRVIQDRINAIAPCHPTQFSNTNKGIIAKFNADEDCNFIFAPGSIREFQANRLYASLSPYTQKDRNIYITDPPNEIFALPEHEIRNELQIKHRTDIIGLSKFISKRTQRKYFIITPINKEETRKIATLGKVYLFNYELPAQAKRNDPVHNTQNTVRQGAPRSDLSHNPAHFSGPHQSSSSLQLSGPPGPGLPAHSYLTGAQHNLSYQAAHRQQPFWSSTPPPIGPIPHVQPIQTATNGPAQQPAQQLNVPNGSPPYQVPHQGNVPIQNGPPGAQNAAAVQTNQYVPNGSPSYQIPHHINVPNPNEPLGAQNAAAAQPNQYGSMLGSHMTSPQGIYGQNEKNLIVYSYNIINLCNSLSTGVETPENFVSNFNLILSENGLIPINVPKAVIESSNKIYLSKQSNGPSPSTFTITSHPTTPIASQPTTPIVTQSTTPTVSQSPPITSQPVTPTVPQLATPIVSKPATPTVFQSETPFASQSTTLNVSQTATPISSQSVTPIDFQSTTLPVLQSTTPIDSQPVASIVSVSTNPSVSQSTPPIISQSITPTVTHASSPISPPTPNPTATLTSITTTTSTASSLPAYQVTASTTSSPPVSTPNIETESLPINNIALASTPIQRHSIPQYTTPLANLSFNSASNNVNRETTPITTTENTPGSTIHNMSNSLSNLISNFKQSTPINLLRTNRNNLFRTNMGWSRNKPLFDI